MSKDTDEFSNIPMPRRQFADKTFLHQYRVYRAPDDFKLVDAETALEALRIAEIPNPWKVVKEAKFHETFVDDAQLGPPEMAPGEDNPNEMHGVQSLMGADVSGMIDT